MSYVLAFSKMGHLSRCHSTLQTVAFVVLLVICVLINTTSLTLVPQVAPKKTHLNGNTFGNSLIRAVSSYNGSSRILRSTSSDSPSLPSYRLEKSVTPEKYFLTIAPILDPGFENSLGEQWYAPGSVMITVTAVTSVKKLTLHAKNITIHNVTVVRVHGMEREEMIVENVSYNARHTFMTIHLQNHLIREDSYEINMVFTAYISETLNGLFRSSYKNEETGEIEWFAATHMEALHARQMFPCFDEPSYKAIFEAKIGRNQNYMALFNTESVGNETMENVDGWVWETFAPTVKMSTYLTALVVAKFQYAEASGQLLPFTRVRTYAPPHYVMQDAVQYAADIAEKILHIYGEYFMEPYPMKKFDSVAVPSFLYGAMENFGLSIFRETLLLHFNNRTSESERYIVTNVICHELGHQWFGNLVSPRWWTHLWLSEGLTKFTEYIGLNATIPEFQPWDIFVSESLQLGLRLDADQRTSHSLKIDEDAWIMKSEMEWFDDIAYKKGGSLIRMMQGFLTEPVLRKGMSRYLARLKYKTAVQDDLFSDCDKEAQLARKLPENTTLKQIMTGWTLQSGFPLLTVEIDGVTGSSDANKIRVTQSKYYSSRAQRTHNTNHNAFRWFIPVSVATSKHPNFDPMPEFWIRENESSVTVTLPANSWVILNAGTTGFYRVIYDEALTNRITDQLMEFPQKIDKLARSQLMDDYFNAVWNRYIPIQRALNLTRYMKHHAETEHVVWTSVLSMLKTAFRLFKDSREDFSSLKTYMLPRIENAIVATGGFSAINMSSRGIAVVRHAQLLDWACGLESTGCIEYASKLMNSWKSTDQMSIPTDFRAVVMAATVSNDVKSSVNSDLFEFVLEKYKGFLRSDDGQGGKLKEQLLTALSSTRDVDKINKLIRMAFKPDSLNSAADASSLLQSLASNVKAADTILQYFVDNAETIVDQFGSPEPIITTANAMAPHLKSLNSLFMIEKLVQRNVTMFKDLFVPVVNRIRANIIWYDEFGEGMLDFFDQNK